MNNIIKYVVWSVVLPAWCVMLLHAGVFGGRGRGGGGGGRGGGGGGRGGPGRGGGPKKHHHQQQ